jgi:hypothetical protein
MSDALLILRPPADLDTGVSLREICGSWIGEQKF